MDYRGHGAKSLVDWGQQGESKENRVTFFHKIAHDIETMRVCLLLTGIVQGAKNQVHAYLDTFKKYDWLWKTKKERRTRTKSSSRTSGRRGQVSTATRRRS